MGRPNNANSRRMRIQEMLAVHGRARINELARAMGVASMTVRRDIARLETEGLVLRTHGGCVPRSMFVTEAAFAEKENLRRAQKGLIAAAAVKLVRRGMRIYLDTGTTCLQISRLLPAHMELAVFTNNLRAALELMGRPGVEVIVYGGRLAARSPDLTGDYAVARMADHMLDVAFVGGDALDVATGSFYAADMATALMSRMAQRQAGKVVAVLDSSKFGKRSVAVAGRLAQGMTLVSDDGLRGAMRRRLRACGAEIILAAGQKQERGVT